MSDLALQARASTSVLGSVFAERVRQHKKWGVQHHPDGTGGEELEADAAEARNFCDQAHKDGWGTWQHILREEFCEAMAEGDPGKLREELVQVAAVAVAWVEDIDSREATT